MARGNGPKRMAKQAAIKAGDHPGVHISYHPSETAESIAAYDPQLNRVLGWNSYGWVLHGAFDGATVEYTIFNRSLDIETLSHILSECPWDFLLVDLCLWGPIIWGLLAMLPLGDMSYLACLLLRSGRYAC